MSLKRAQHPDQQSSASPTNEKHIFCKRDLYLPQKSPIFLTKEPNILFNRALGLLLMRPVSPAKKPYISRK